MAKTEISKEQDPRMSAPEFRAALVRLELGEKAAARFFQVNLSTVQQWLEVGPSGPVDKLTRMLLKHRWTGATADRYLEGERVS